MVNSIILFSILLFMLSKMEWYRIPGLKSYAVLTFFMLKVVSAVLVWTYFYYKPGFGDASDMYQFFKIANEFHLSLPLTEELKLIFGISPSTHAKNIIAGTEYWSKLYDYGFMNDNRIMIRINMLIRFISGGSYLSHALIFTFIGFNGLFFLLKIAQQYLKTAPMFIAIILFLLPSGFIWTSNMFKETLLLFTIGGLGYFITQIIQSKKPFRPILYTLLLLLILLQTKPLFSLLFLYSLLCFGIHRLIQLKFTSVRFVYTFFVPLTTIILLSSLLSSRKTDQMIHEQGTFNIALLLKNKQDDFFFDVHQFNPHTVLPLRRMNGTYTSVIKTIPDALTHIFVAPFNMCIKKWEILPFALEIVVLLLLTLLSLRFPTSLCREQKEYLQMMLFPSILALFVVGCIIPIEGLLVKYTAPALVLIVWITALKTDLKKLRGFDQ